MAEAGKYNVREMIEKGPEVVALLEKYALQHFYRVIKRYVLATKISLRKSRRDK